MWFGGWSELLRVVAISLTIYAFLIVLLRWAGKRSLAKLNIFDFVVTIALGSTLASIILSKDVSFAEGGLAFVMLAGLQFTVSWLSVRQPWFRELIRTDARLLLQDGKFLKDNMRVERVTHDEILAAIRKHGIGKVENVAAVVLETDGSLSVIEDGPAAQLSALDPLVRGSGDTE